MNNENKEHKALITRLIADLKILHDNTAKHLVYEACDRQFDAANSFIEMWNNPSYALSHAYKLFLVNKKLRSAGVTEKERKDKLLKAFVDAFRNWANQSPSDEQIDEGIAWWCFVTGRLRIDEDIWPKVLIHRMKTDYNGWLEHIKELKVEGAIPHSLKPEEIAQVGHSQKLGLGSLLLNLDKLIKFDGQHLPPGHPIWKSLDVNNISEYKAKSPILETFKLAKPEYFNRVMRAVLTHAKSAYAHQGMSDKLEYKSEDIVSAIENKVAYLNDDDRLSQTCELIGIDMDALTEGESNRILDLLHAFDIGYSKASKTGVPLAAYYGDKADSEKTQRQRLFKKIREASDKTK